VLPDVSAAKLIELTVVSDPRGDLSFLTDEVAFSPRRMMFIRNMPPGARRGGHAHRKSWQFFLPLSGSFRAVLDDGVSGRSFLLSDPNAGLLVPPVIFVDLEEFSADAVVLLLASEPYDKAEYIGSREELRDIRQTVS